MISDQPRRQISPGTEQGRRHRRDMATVGDELNGPRLASTLDEPNIELLHASPDCLVLVDEYHQVKSREALVKGSRITYAI